MKLANLRDEDLWKVAKLKTRKGTATSDAKRAMQILRTRNITHGGFCVGGVTVTSHTDQNVLRQYQTFEELHGCSLEVYLGLGGK